jgi:hypothetical protein
MTICAVLVAAVALAAQDPAIDADRPHVGTGAHVVAPGEVQVEAGVQWQQSSDIRTFGSPVLVRIGAVDRLELRAATDGLLSRHSPETAAYGMGNVQLGAKIRLLGGREEPFFSVMPTINLGVARADRQLGSGETDATLTWLAGHSAGRRFHIEGNYGIGAIGAPGTHFIQHLLTGAVIHQSTRTVQTYVEAASWSRQEIGGTAVGFIDYGLIAALTPRLLVDVGAFSGVTRQAPDWGVFSGVSFAVGGRDFHQQLGRRARADRQRAIAAAEHH